MDRLEATSTRVRTGLGQRQASLLGGACQLLLQLLALLLQLAVALLAQVALVLGLLPILQLAGQLLKHTGS